MGNEWVATPFEEGSWPRRYERQVRMGDHSPLTDAERAYLVEHGGLGVAESLGVPTHELVAAARDLLGAKLVAYIGSAPDTAVVARWCGGEVQPQPDVLQRIRVGAEAARVLRRRESATVVQAWFQGANEYLDDVAPARLLRDGDVNEAGRRVMAAADRHMAR